MVLNLRNRYSFDFNKEIEMGKVQAYPSDEVCEKINAIVEKRRMEGQKIRMSAFPVYLQCYLS
jgi:hypothetical protein